jgi:hypothetical protein
MEFAVNTPGGQVRLADLPLEVLSQLEEETGRRWVELILSPAYSAATAIAVYKAACAHNGSEPQPLTPRRLIEGIGGGEAIFEQVEDDLPTLYEEGLPKAEDETSTSG